MYLYLPHYVNQRAVHSTVLVPLYGMSGHRESCALLKEQQVLDLSEIVGNIVHHRQISYLICTEALGHAAL